MIAFGPMSLLSRIRYALFPRYRRLIDIRRRRALRYLLQHPEVPCVIDGHYIEDGYGNNCLRGDYLSETFGIDHL